MHLINRATITAALLLLAVCAATFITRHYRAEVSLKAQHSMQFYCRHTLSAEDGTIVYSNEWRSHSIQDFFFGDLKPEWSAKTGRSHTTYWRPHAYTHQASSNPNSVDRLIIIPFWLPAAPFIIALTLYGVVRRRPPAPPHKCHACRYDKSGLGPDAPCPECGAPPRNRTPTSTFTAETPATAGELRARRGK